MKKHLENSIRLLNQFDGITTLGLRVVLGIVFIRSGWGKLQHLDKTIEYFQSLGIPGAALQAPFVAAIEFLGGFCIFLGFLVRPVALALTGVMTVALITAIVPGLEDKTEVVSSIELIYLVCFLKLATSNSGVLAIDGFLLRKILR
jgi:putative oxidoreductase